MEGEFPPPFSFGDSMMNGQYEIDGYVCWFQYGVVHREDGPAFIDRFGRKEWYANGNRHRIDGPAVEYGNGYNEWWVGGQKVDIIEVFGHEPSVPLTEDEQMVLRLSA